MIAYGIKLLRKGSVVTNTYTGESRTVDKDVWYASKYGVATLYDTFGKALGVAKRSHKVLGVVKRSHKDFEIVEVELN